MKKAQVETMGLVIIVVLIALVGLFALIFMSSEDSDRHEDLFLGMKANNLANSLRVMTIGLSDFGLRVMDCCSGIDNAACDDVEGASESGFELLDEKASVEVVCFSGGVHNFGDCSMGIRSEEIVLSSGDMFFITICRR